MTLRKYKKLLMSYGVDRDLAEVNRRRHASTRRVLITCKAPKWALEPEEDAAMMMELYHGKNKNRIISKHKTLRLIRDNAIVV